MYVTEFIQRSLLLLSLSPKLPFTQSGFPPGLYHVELLQLPVNLFVMKSFVGGGVKAVGHEEGVGEGPGEPEAQTLDASHRDSVPLWSVQSQSCSALHLRPLYAWLQSPSAWHGSFQLPLPPKSHSPVLLLHARGFVQLPFTSHAPPFVFPSAAMQLFADI